jgi:hypothetical protein
MGGTIRTDRARKAFLEMLAEECNVSEACRAANIGRTSAYAWKADDPEFAAQWVEAEEQAADKLEKLAWERAKSGQSDRMLEILLKGHRPKYRDKQTIDATLTVRPDYSSQVEAEIAEILTPHLIEVKHGE